MRLPRRAAAAVAIALLAVPFPYGCALFRSPEAPLATSGNTSQADIPPYLRRDPPPPESEERERAVRAAHPDWPDGIVRAVAKGEPVPGMTREQAAAALGRGPYKVKREKTGEGEMEFWQVDWAYNSRRLLFRDGLLLEVLPSTQLSPRKAAP